MKKSIYFFLVSLCVGITSCGSGSDDILITTPINPGGGVPEEKIEDVIAKHVTANISFNESQQLYTANIETSLSDKYPNKDIKYGMTADWGLKIHTSTNKTYLEEDYYYRIYKNVQVEMLYNGSGDDPIEGVYATGTGSRYTVSFEKPKYCGISHYNGEQRENLDEPMFFDDPTLTQFWNAWNMIGGIEKHIADGTATEDEMKVYESALAQYNDLKDKNILYTEGWDDYCYSAARVFVEIDNNRYFIKEERGSVRLLKYGDYKLYHYGAHL